MPSPKKGRIGKASAPKGKLQDLSEDEDMKSKTTRGGKKSARGRGRGKASVASRGSTSRRGRGKKVVEEEMPQLPSQEVSNAI